MFETEVDPQADPVVLTDRAVEWLRRVITTHSDHCMRITALSEERDGLPNADKKSIDDAFRDRPVTLFSMLSIPPEVVLASGVDSLSAAVMLGFGENFGKSKPNNILRGSPPNDALMLVLLMFEAAIESCYLKTGVTSFIHLIETMCSTLRRTESSRMLAVINALKNSAHDALPDEVRKLLDESEESTPKN